MRRRLSVLGVRAVAALAAIVFVNLAISTPARGDASAAAASSPSVGPPSESDRLTKGQAADLAGRLRGCGCAAAVDMHLDAGDHNIDFVAAETSNVVTFLDAEWQDAVTQSGSKAAKTTNATKFSSPPDPQDLPDPPDPRDPLSPRTR